nr:hypothetical protein [Maliibacterium massiliense]
MTRKVKKTAATAALRRQRRCCAFNGGGGKSKYKWKQTPWLCRHYAQGKSRDANGLSRIIQPPLPGGMPLQIFRPASRANKKCPAACLFPPLRSLLPCKKKGWRARKCTMARCKAGRAKRLHFPVRLRALRSIWVKSLLKSDIVKFILRNACLPKRFSLRKRDQMLQKCEDYSRFVQIPDQEHLQSKIRRVQ